MLSIMHAIVKLTEAMDELIDKCKKCDAVYKHDKCNRYEMIHH